jgi:threonine dehydrogenase-like Zn-dependent dehydrogenase
MASTGAVTLAPLVTHRLPLESLQKGMVDALSGAPVMKVLIDLGA